MNLPGFGLGSGVDVEGETGAGPERSAIPPAPTQPAAAENTSTPPNPISHSARATPPSQAATPLGIPPQALDSGDVSFMDGHWRSLTGLMENRTGKPIVVEYDFKNGQGSATISRSDGVACRGPAGAVIQGTSLVVSQQGNLVCGDGTAYAPSDVKCTLDENQNAVCQGQYPGGDKYNVEIVR